MKSTDRKSLIQVMLTVLLLFFVTTAYAAEQGKMSSAAAGAQKTKMAAAAKMSKTQMTVSGMIVANKNKAGKVTSFALQEDSGENLLLSKHGKGKQLRKMVGKKVEATGTVQESKGKKWITVKEFKEIE